MKSGGKVSGKPLWVVSRGFGDRFGWFHDFFGDFVHDLGKEIEIWVISRFGWFGGRFGWFRGHFGWFRGFRERCGPIRTPPPTRPLGTST